MERFKTPLLIVLAFVGGSLVSLATTLVLANGSDPNQIHSCVKNNTLLNGANVRIVGINVNCANNETPVNWPATASTGGGSGALGTLGVSIMCNGCDLSYLGNKFKGNDFTNAYAPNIVLASTDISGVIFKGSHMQQSSFNDSNLSNADFTSAILYQSFFQNTNLTNVNFTNADLTGSDLNTATLTGVTWSNTTCPDGTNSNSHGNTCISHL